MLLEISRLPSPCPGAQRPGDGAGLTAELCVMTTFSITRLKFTVVLARGRSGASLNRLSECRESPYPSRHTYHRCFTFSISREHPSSSIKPTAAPCTRSMPAS